MWAAEAKLKKDFRVTKTYSVKKDTIVTITRGRDKKYAIWLSKGIFDIPRKYIDELSLKILSNQ
jgi:hypothetical protein